MPYPSKLTPDLVLNAAETLLDQGGPEAVAMRTLGDVLGVRASSLYRYFPDRSALLHALEERITVQLAQAVMVSAGGPPREALLGAAHAYLTFAAARPQAYGLILATRTPTPAQPGAGKSLWNMVLALVGAVTEQEDDTAAAVAFWAYLHGFATLQLSGQLGLSGARGGFERGLQALLDGLTPDQPDGFRLPPHL